MTKLTEVIGPAFIEVHRDIKAKGHREYMLKGGRGSLKSSFASIEIVLGIIGDPEANAICYRKVANTLRDSVYTSIIRAIDWLGLGRYFATKVSPLEIIYKPTKQRIMFRGADDPSKSKSISLRHGYFKYLWFEELAEFQGIDAIRTIRASVIRGGSGSVVLMTYNPPKSAQNWVNAEALIPTKGRLVHTSDYTQAPPEWLGEEFIAEAEALRETNERAWRHMYMGEVTGTGGQVFDNLQLREIPDSELDTMSVFMNGLDFGFAVDPDAFVRWAYDRKRSTIYAVSEFFGARNATDRLAAEVSRRAGRDIIRCDSADPRMINELQQRGLRAQGVKKGPGSVDHGVRWLQDLRGIVIDPKRTPNIAREFAAYEYAQDKDGNFLTEYPDKNNHTIDATRYALDIEMQARKLQTMKAGSLGL